MAEDIIKGQKAVLYLKYIYKCLFHLAVCYISPNPRHTLISLLGMGCLQHQLANNNMVK